MNTNLLDLNNDVLNIIGDYVEKDPSTGLRPVSAPSSRRRRLWRPHSMSHSSGTSLPTHCIMPVCHSTSLSCVRKLPPGSAYSP